MSVFEGPPGDVDSVDYCNRRSPCDSDSSPPDSQTNLMSSDGSRGSVQQNSRPFRNKARGSSENRRGKNHHRSDFTPLIPNTRRRQDSSTSLPRSGANENRREDLNLSQSSSSSRPNDSSDYRRPVPTTRSSPVVEEGPMTYTAAGTAPVSRFPSQRLSSSGGGSAVSSPTASVAASPSASKQSVAVVSSYAGPAPSVWCKNGENSASGHHNSSHPNHHAFPALHHNNGRREGNGGLVPRGNRRGGNRVNDSGRKNLPSPSPPVLQPRNNGNNGGEGSRGVFRPQPLMPARHSQHLQHKTLSHATEDVSQTSASQSDNNPARVKQKNSVDMADGAVTKVPAAEETREKAGAGGRGAETAAVTPSRELFVPGNYPSATRGPCAVAASGGQGGGAGGVGCSPSLTHSQPTPLLLRSNSSPRENAMQKGASGLRLEGAESGAAVADLLPIAHAMQIATSAPPEAYLNRSISTLSSISVPPAPNSPSAYDGKRSWRDVAACVQKTHLQRASPPDPDIQKQTEVPATKDEEETMDSCPDTTENTSLPCMNASFSSGFESAQLQTTWTRTLAADSVVSTEGKQPPAAATAPANLPTPTATPGAAQPLLHLNLGPLSVAAESNKSSPPASLKEPTPTGPSQPVRQFSLEQQIRLPTPPTPESPLEQAPPAAPSTASLDDFGGFHLSMMDVLSEEIWHYHTLTAQTEVTLNRKLHLRDMLYWSISPVFPMCGLYVIGSSLNGFGNNSSDMDLCLMITNKDLDQKSDAVVVLNMIMDNLKLVDFVAQQQLITAKVPILRINFHAPFSDITVDLNANNSVAIKNTHLLCYYSSFDWRVRPLVSVIKEWAKKKGINDANRSSFTSYSLVLMLIHYLQCGLSPAVLPSLQSLYSSRFSRSADVRALNVTQPLSPPPSDEWQFNRESTLGELLIGFLEYYAEKFDYDQHAISVRLGRKLDRTQVVKGRGGYGSTPATNNWRSQWRCVCIEEPFTHSNTAHSVYDELVFAQIKNAFREAYQELDNTRDLSRLLNSRPIQINLPTGHFSGVYMPPGSGSAPVLRVPSTLPAPSAAADRLPPSQSFSSLSTAHSGHSSSASSSSGDDPSESPSPPSQQQHLHHGHHQQHPNLHQHRRLVPQHSHRGRYQGPPPRSNRNHLPANPS